MSAKKVQYHFGRLSQEEERFIETVLMEEIDMQTWFAVRCLDLMGSEEQLIPIQ